MRTKAVSLFLVVFFAGCGNDSRNILGSSGGTFTMNGVTVIIPPNAVDKDIQFSVEKISPTGNSINSFRIEQSIQFSKPVTLILPYCGVCRSNLPADRSKNILT